MSTIPGDLSPRSLAGTPAASPLGYVSWAFGQGARDPYYILVVIYIFYPYFSNTVVGNPVEGQSLLGYTNAIAGFALALLAPFLGAIADKDGRRKPWVAGSVVFMVAGAVALWWALPGGAGLSIFTILALIVCINIAFTINEVFHNAMLPSTAPANRVGFVSGIAFSIGNVGGLSLMLFVLIAFSLPGTSDWSFLPAVPLFGIDQGAHEHDRIVGPIAAAWMLIFTLPLLLFTPDGQGRITSVRKAAREGLQDVIETLSRLRHYRNIALYLISRMFMIDGMVGVMTFGGVYASGTFGWDTTTLLIFGLCTSASAMVGAYIGGWIDDLVGSKRALQIAIAMSSIILMMLVSYQPGVLFFFVNVGTDAVWNFPYFRSLPEILYFLTNQIFALFFVTGLSSSRTLMARLAPPEMATQFFGLFALSGTVTAFLAPLMVGTLTDWFDSQRAGMASLTVLMVIGFVLLLKVQEVQTVAHLRTPRPSV
ncbi:MAG: MFS transporter [Pseudomonadales bacterium]